MSPGWQRPAPGAIRLKASVRDAVCGRSMGARRPRRCGLPGFLAGRRIAFRSDRKAMSGGESRLDHLGGLEHDVRNCRGSRSWKQDWHCGFVGWTSRSIGPAGMLPFATVCCCLGLSDTCPSHAAALFDGRHDLELTQAQVAALRLAPSGPVRAEDVGDLQGGTPHEGGLRRRQHVQWADHLAQHLGGHVGVHRGGLQPMDFSP